MNTLISTWKKNNYGREFGAVLGILLVSVMIGSPSAWAGCTYVDPQVSPSGYRAWCECIGGRYLERPYRCIPGASKGKSQGGTKGPVIDWRAEKQRHDALRRQQEAEERRRQLEEAEREAKRRNGMARQKFLKDQADALNRLKGTKSGTLNLKSGTATLGLKNPNPTGQLNLKGSSEDRKIRAISTEWKQHYCGRWITGYTFPAAQKGDVEEIRFLGTQAMKAFRGGPLELQCPETQPPAEIYEGVVIGPDSPVEKFYMKILRLSEKEAVRMMEAEKEIWEIQKDKQKVHKGVEEKQRVLIKLKEEIKEIKKVIPPPDAKSEEKKADKKAVPEKKDTKAADELVKKKRALEAALAALKKAKKAEADVDKSIANAEKEMSKAQKNLKGYEDMFNKVKKEPALAREYMSKVGE